MCCGLEDIERTRSSGCGLTALAQAASSQVRAAVRLGEPVATDGVHSAIARH